CPPWGMFGNCVTFCCSFATEKFSVTFVRADAMLDHRQFYAVGNGLILVLRRRLRVLQRLGDRRLKLLNEGVGRRRRCLSHAWPALLRTRPARHSPCPRGRSGRGFMVPSPD